MNTTVVQQLTPTHEHKMLPHRPSVRCSRKDKNGTTCHYPSKHCSNPRARKINGTLHRLCNDHRMRANENQRRWTEARRTHVGKMRKMLQSPTVFDQDPILDVLVAETEDLWLPAFDAPVMEPAMSSAMVEDMFQLLLSEPLPFIPSTETKAVYW